MAGVLRTLFKRSSVHFRFFKNPSHIKPPLYKWLTNRSIHGSTVLGHHLPRDPNRPYNPPWKPNPLFPPGTYKKAFEKIKAKTAIITDFTVKIWDFYDRTMKLVGPFVATMAAIMFYKNKELEQERKNVNKESSRILVLSQATLDVAIKEFKAAADVEKRIDQEVLKKKEKVVEEILRMEDISVGDKVIVAEKIVENEVLMMMFLGATNDVKKEIVKAILGDGV